MLPALIVDGCVEADGDGGILVRVHAQPRAARNAFAGVHDGALKFRVTVPPVEGKANALIAEVMAKMFRVSKSSVSLVSGSQSKHKRFRVVGVTLPDALEIIAGAGI